MRSCLPKWSSRYWGEGPLEKSHSSIIAQLRSLGVARGGVLLVHTAFRNVRPVQRGPDGLIDALLAALGPEGTLVMPAWGDEDDEPFDPSYSPIAADLGIVPSLFGQRPGVIRSDHIHAFAAIGPRAGTVLRDPLPIPPHGPKSPVGRVHELDGQVLLLGVGHDANTTIHLAEVLAEVPYGLPKYCTVMHHGNRLRVDYLENDHCCERFNLVDRWLRDRALQKEGPVGNATARLVRSRAIVDIVMQRLVKDPLLFLHPPGSGCAECDEARASAEGPKEAPLRDERTHG